MANPYPLWRTDGLIMVCWAKLCCRQFLWENSVIWMQLLMDPKSL